MPSEENLRIQITLSPDEAKALKLWAAYHGKPPATYAAQIVASRIESNLDLIDRLVERAARSRGITVEELEKDWLSD